METRRQKLRTSRETGPFNRDVVTDRPNEVGTGSPGLVWRLRGSGGNVAVPAVQTAIDWVGETEDGEAAVEMVQGLAYDVELHLVLDNPGVGVSTIAVNLEYWDPVAEVWATIVIRTFTLADPTNALVYVVEWPDANFDGFDPDITITRFRATVEAIVGTTGRYNASQSVLRITQYAR